MGMIPERPKSYSSYNHTSILSDEEWASMKKDAEEYDKAVKETRDGWVKAFKELISQSKQIFSGDQDFIKKLEKIQIPYYSGIVFNVETWRRNAKDKQEAEDKKQKEIKAIQDLEAKKARAVVWLLERGKHPGKDYEACRAIETANQMAFDEEVARQGPGPHDFSGQNCGDYDDTECSGWDGSSRRCECGNRRVSWVEGYGHSFEEPCVYAEAD